MQMKRWPRKNDPASIRERQQQLGLNGGVTGIDLSPFVSAQEMLTGAAVIPVSVVGPLELELGEYELEEPFGRVTETGRARDAVFVPLAHTEGGLSASLYRGAAGWWRRIRGRCEPDQSRCQSAEWDRRRQRTSAGSRWPSS